MEIKTQPGPRPVIDVAAPDPEQQKQQLLRDWQRFIYSGFQRLFFTRGLYTFLNQQCAFRGYDQETFWRRYFDAETVRLQAFLNQFGGNLRSAEEGARAWLGGPEAELKEAMCEQMAELYAPLSQVLEDLEARYEELIALWQEFARQAGAPPGRPPQHRLSANSRSLLAYAAAIAFKVQHPLEGLQLHLLPASPPPASLPLPAGLEPVEVTWLD